MIEGILNRFENVRNLPTSEEIGTSDERVLTEVEFELTKILMEKYPEFSENYISTLKRRWKDRWC
jgi:hypothetical protein